MLWLVVALAASCSRTMYNYNESGKDAAVTPSDALASDARPDLARSDGGLDAQADGGSCTANEQCAGVCISGRCTAPAAVGQPCDPEEDEDCAGGICVSGICRENPCTPLGRADDDGHCLRSCPAPAESPPCSGGTCYYIAASGGSDDNSGTSATDPWATFSHAWDVIKPGETLILLDGVYNTALAPSVSGEDGAPITIRAQNDGKAVIDGQLSRQACRFNNVSHLVLEGFRCRNHDADMVNSGLFFIGDSSYIVARRITVANSNLDCSLVHVYRSSDVLIEDVAAWGTSDTVFSAFGSERVTFRRCWAELPVPGPVGAYASGVSLSRTSDSLVENCIVVANGPINYEGTAFPVGGSETEAASNNRLLGNIAVDLTGHWPFTVASAGVAMRGNRYANNVVIDSGYGIFQRADADMVVDRQTLANTANTCFSLRAYDSTTYEPGAAIGGEVKNSVLVGGTTGFSLAEAAGILPSLVHDYNVLYNVTTPFGQGTSQSANELVDDVEPQYDTATFGNGAYLIAPANLSTAGSSGGPIGAEVLYRYQDGQLTCVPLWPWPMEQRIIAEHGVSPTWDTDGGPWKTLDGVYPPAAP